MIGDSNPQHTEPDPPQGPVSSSRVWFGLRLVKGRRWWILPLWLAALTGSLHQAARAACASILLMQDRELTTFLQNPQFAPLDGQRFIQRHFLSFGIYIPMEDIVIRGLTSDQPAIVPMTQQVCGEGLAFIWVPLRFQLPVVGEKVLEWCLVKA